MKIVMMGSGGVGGYYGARLLQAGHDVSFVFAVGAPSRGIREVPLLFTARGDRCRTGDVVVRWLAQIARDVPESR